MKTALLVLTTSLVGVAWADGLPLKNGRYPGEVLVFTLTAEQVQVIEHYRTCQFERSQAMNSYTPYVFKLTASQAEALRSKKGFTPDLFQVYETYLGFNDAGPHWNLILRCLKFPSTWLFETQKRRPRIESRAGRRQTLASLS
jgi:hypothetical protein